MNREFWTLVITMIVGGLTYSVVSFSYMHNTFTTRTEVDAQKEAADKYELTIERRLERIEDKLDRVLGR